MYKKIISYVKREGLLAFFLKILDFVLIPFGISFISFLNLKDYDLTKNPYVENNSNNQTIFSKIYEDHYWKSKESVSGSGSDLNALRKYNKNLYKFIDNFKIKSLFDVPCGDFLFMSKFLQDKNISYIGGDIVESLINNNKKKFPKYKFIKFDILNDKINDFYDVLHVKDCLFHFSFEDINKTLDNIIQFNTKYTLITSHKSLILKNVDIKTGKFRYLDLEKKPFNFPKPLVELKDYNFNIGNFPRYVGVWKTEDLKKHIKK